MKTQKLISFATAFLVFLVAVGSFALSYNALRQVAIDNGIQGNLSYVWPLLIDFSLIVFSLAVVNAYLHSQDTKKQWALVGVYTISTIGFNVAHAPANLQAQIVASIAPVSLFFSFEILMTQLKDSVKRQMIVKSIKDLQTDFTQRQTDLTLRVDTLSNEIDTRQIQLDKLTEQIQLKQGQLNKLNEQIEQSESVKSNSILQAKALQIEQAQIDKESRLSTLVDILRVSPDLPVSTIAEQLSVSRTTVYNDLSTLEQQGTVSKNGNGYRVTL